MSNVTIRVRKTTTATNCAATKYLPFLLRVFSSFVFSLLGMLLDFGPNERKKMMN